MNTIDFIVIGIVLGSGLIGLLRGFVREVLSICTWIGAAAATYFFFSFTKEFARGHISNPMIADGVTIVVLFIALLIIFSIICGIISDLVRKSTLGGIDRSLGLGFGLVRGVILIAVCEVVLSAFTPRQNQSESIQTARFTPLARQFGDKLLEILPSNAKSFILSQSHKAVTAVPPAILSPEMPSLEQIPGQAFPETPQQGTPPNMSGVSPVPNENPSAEAGNPMAVPPPHAILPSLPGAPQQQQVAPNQTPIPQDPQKTADALAHLKPQVTGEKKNDDGYNQNQRHDMDRLFQTAQ